MGDKNLKKLKRIVYILIIIFIINSFVPPHLGAISLSISLIYIALGIVLIILTLKSKVNGKLKVFLLLTGLSSAGTILGILHGFLEVLNLEILSIIFFYIAVIVSPILFLIATIGSIISFKRKL
jgi:hypothetical protein